MVTRLQDAWAASPDNSYTSLDVTFGSAPTDGSALFMAVGSEGAEVTTINQTGATWVKANGVTIFGSSLDLWVAQNVVGADITATIVLDGSAHVAGILVEYSGLVQTGAIIDQVGSPQAGTSSVHVSTDSPISQPSELLIATIACTGGSLQENPTNGFTEVNQILQAGFRRLGFYNRVASAVAYYDTTLQISPANISLGFMTTFFAEGGAPPSSKAFLAAALPKKMG